MMEIEFPIEFIVQGTPVSLQAKRHEARDEWKERVKKSSFTAIPCDHYASDDPISITLYYFPSGSMTGDIDNIVKPILDALSHHIYRDDRQVERVVVQKFEKNVFKFKDPTKIFSEALGGKKPLLYVRLTNNPSEELL